MLIWYISYTNAHQHGWQLLVSCLFLALTILANFFSATTALIFITTTLIADVLRYRQGGETAQKTEAQSALCVHLIHPSC
jgi:hypothetical protein